MARSYPIDARLTEDSFRRAKEDPLKSVRSVPTAVEEALTFRNGCVYCHNFRGSGARSHHVHALTVKPYGGFALAFKDYPPEVWRDFVFDQLEVAENLGATPNIVQENARQALFEMVNKARAQALAK